MCGSSRVGFENDFCFGRKLCFFTRLYWSLEENLCVITLFDSASILWLLIQNCSSLSKWSELLMLFSCDNILICISGSLQMKLILFWRNVVIFFCMWWYFRITVLWVNVIYLNTTNDIFYEEVIGNPINLRSLFSLHTIKV